MREKVYSILFTKSSEKQYHALSEKVQHELALILEEIARDPLLGKPLQGPLKGLRSKRAGNFRIIYEQKKSELIITVINIGQRKSVYKRKK